MGDPDFPEVGLQGIRSFETFAEGQRDWHYFINR